MKVRIAAAAALGAAALSLTSAQEPTLSGTVLQAAKMNLSGLAAFDPHAEAQIGWSVAYLSDLDRDGLREVATGAPRDDSAGTNAGAVWLMSLDPTQRIVTQRKITLPELLPGDLFGHAVANLGDVDGDGVADLAVGAPGDDTGGPNRGAVHVLFLRADGSVRQSVKIASLRAGFQGALDAGDQFGYALTGPGDLDGDRVPDLVVGVPGDDDGQPPSVDRGAVWVLFLDRFGHVRAQQKISERTGVTGPPVLGLKLKNGDQFGCSLATVGDVDRDSRNEIVVGALGADAPHAVNSGAVFVLTLRADGMVERFARIDADAPALRDELTGSDAFGVAVAGLGDLDRDGILDLAVAVERESQATSGSAWILLLDPAGGVKSKRRLASAEIEARVRPSDRFGRGLAPLGLSFFSSVVDQGFEGGASSPAWVQASTNFGTPLCNAVCAGGSGAGAGPRSGSWCLRFGGIAKREVGSVEQSVAIRSDTLGFYLWNPISSGGTGNFQDKLTVRIDGNVVFQAVENDPLYAGGYRQVLVDVSAYNNGATHLLRFEGDITGTMAAGKVGRSDFLVDDILLFETPRVGPVGVLVGAPNDDDLGPNAGMLWSLSLEGPVRARALARNGHGGNPNVYATTAEPILGKTWTASITRNNRNRTVVFATLDPLPGGLPVSIGEVLVDLGSPLVFTSIVNAPPSNPPAALTHSFPVPSSLGLVGLRLATQGYRDLNGTAQLLNAIDLTIGY